jgi:trimeric autotransporter adhesin
VNVVSAAAVDVEDTNALTVSGIASSSTVAVDAGGVLTTSGTVQGTSVSLIGDGGISLGANVNATGGTLNLTSTNTAITQTAGTVTASGTTTVAAGTGAVTLSQSTNDFGTVTTVSAGSVDLADANTIDLGTSSLTGNLVVTAVSGITDSGTVSVGTTTALTTTGAGADIDLGTLASSGTVALNTTGASSDATVVNATTLALAASNVGGNLSATATTGDVTVTNGDVNVGGTLTLSGEQILGNGVSTINMLSTGAIGLTATAGDIGAINGNLDGTSVPDVNLNIAGNPLTVSIPAGAVTYLRVNSGPGFVATPFSGLIGATPLNTWGCFTATQCVNLNNQASELGQSVGSAVVSSLLADASQQAFGTDNLTIAIQDGILTKIGVTPPGIDDIQGELGSLECNTSVSNNGAIRSEPACAR